MISLIDMIGWVVIFRWIAAELSDGKGLFWVERLPQPRRWVLLEQLRQGQVAIEPPEIQGTRTAYSHPRRHPSRGCCAEPESSRRARLAPDFGIHPGRVTSFGGRT